MSDEVTPTIEEFVYSFLPGRWFDPTLENAFYWSIKTIMLAAPPLAHTAWLMMRGVPFMEAGYIATDTFGMARFVGKVSRFMTPAFVVPATLAYLGTHYQHQAMAEAGSGVRGTGSIGVAPSMHLQGGKPWWE